MSLTLVFLVGSHGLSVVTHGPRYTKWTSSSCTPMFFFLHPHNFLNPETDLDFLFGKGAFLSLEASVVGTQGMRGSI